MTKARGLPFWGGLRGGVTSLSLFGHRLSRAGILLRFPPVAPKRNIVQGIALEVLLEAVSLVNESALAHEKYSTKAGGAGTEAICDHR